MMKCIHCYKETNLKLDLGYCEVPLCNSCKRLTERLSGNWGIPFPEIHELNEEYDEKTLKR